MRTKPEQLGMLLDRLTRAQDDPALCAVEAVMLRTAIERFDDWLLWLDGHVVSDHGADEATAVVLGFLAATRARLAHELRLVDDILATVSS